MSQNAALDYSSDVSSLGTSRPQGLKVLQFERRLLIEDVGARWDDRITERLQNLVRLEPGWDGYNAIPVSFTNASFSLQMLAKVCAPGTPAPAIVPGTDGDLQIEWHTESGDIELHVMAPNVVHAWRTVNEEENPDGEEVLLRNDFSVVAQWVRDIAEPHA